MWMRIWKTIEPRQRRLVYGLFVLMLLSTVFEVVGLGLILPFIQLVSNPSIIHENEKFAAVNQALGGLDYTSFLYLVGVALILGFVLKGLLLTLLNWARSLVVLERLYIPSASAMFSRYLHQPYVDHVQLNSATILRNIVNDVVKLYSGALTAGLNMVAEGLVVAALTVTLLIVSPYLTLITAALLGLTAWFLAAVLRERLIVYSRQQQRARGLTMKWVQEGIGAIKDVKVLGSYDYFIDAFGAESEKFARAGRRSAVANGLPKIVLEIMIVAALVFAIFAANYFARGKGGVNLPELIFLGAAAVRIVPSIIRIVNYINVLRGSQASAEVFVESLDLKTENDDGECDRLPFDVGIELADVSFTYPGTDSPVLTALNLTVEKGQSVAFVGPTGAGKTTIVDIILGLIHPSAGAVLVDGANIAEAQYAWRKNIGYVPQDVFLADMSVRENVVFGQSPNASDEQVWKVLDDAQIGDFIRSLPDGIDTVIGERGVRFSGGQRQRLGIARALFGEPDIIVFDEATSALDNATEARLTDAINELGGSKTLIIIAHRLSTIRSCDRIFLLDQGRLLAAGTYDELLAESPLFRELAAQTELEAAPEF